MHTYKGVLWFIQITQLLTCNSLHATNNETGNMTSNKKNVLQRTRFTNISKKKDQRSLCFKVQILSISLIFKTPCKNHSEHYILQSNCRSIKCHILLWNLHKTYLQVMIVIGMTYFRILTKKSWIFSLLKI